MKLIAVVARARGVLGVGVAALAVVLLACTSEWECDGKCYTERGCGGMEIECPPPGTGMAKPDGGASGDKVGPTGEEPELDVELVERDAGWRS